MSLYRITMGPRSGVGIWRVQFIVDLPDGLDHDRERLRLALQHKAISLAQGEMGHEAQALRVYQVERSYNDGMDWTVIRFPMTTDSGANVIWPR